MDESNIVHTQHLRQLPPHNPCEFVKNIFIHLHMINLLTMLCLNLHFLSSTQNIKLKDLVFGNAYK